MPLSPPRRLRPLLTATLLCCGLFLAACESDEDKAERFYQSGLALLAAGDVDRALLEFRNVFDHDGFHRQARRAYADTLLEQGSTQQAYGQYLRLIEQYPDTVEVRETLAELAIARNDWDEAERHGTAAMALAPDLPGVQAVGLALAYRQAVLDRDEAVRTEVAGQSAEVLERLRADGSPDNAGLVRIVIDRLTTGDTPADALPALDAALERDPGALDLNMTRLQLLVRLGDDAGTGAQLERMVERFPDDVTIQQSMIRWYLSQNDTDGAETYMRALAGDDTGPTEGHVAVVQLLAALRGADAARAELDRLAAANAGTDNARLYTAMLASADFEQGDADTAIATLRGALEGAEPGEQTRQMQAILARMLDSTGKRDEAKTLIDTILAEDSSNVAALKLRAGALIDGDRPGEAIVALRTALDQNPQDADILTLMAMAHQRDGDTDLMGERLSLAVEVSGSRAAEAIRYARFLAGQDRVPVAINVLSDARQRAPGDVGILTLLAELYLRQNDWAGARGIAETLGQIDTDQARQAGPALQAAILQGQDRTEDSLALLESQLDGAGSASDAAAVRATVQIVQTQIRAGRIDEARSFLDETLAKTPDVADLRLLSASVDALMGRTESAEEGYRALAAQFPGAELPVRLLMGLLASQGRDDEVKAVLDAGLERRPDAANLLWIRASMMERAGDIDGAIGVYERLYAADSANIIVANNLASMITTHRSDPESLDRAWAIARRLRDTTVPAFQDTYGWIAYRRGDPAEALRYLEPAATSLPRDALVQYHLGMTYTGLGRTDDARTALTRALDLAGDSPLAQFVTARETLTTLGQ